MNKDTKKAKPDPDHRDKAKGHEMAKPAPAGAKKSTKPS